MHPLPYPSGMGCRIGITKLKILTGEEKDNLIIDEAYIFPDTPFFPFLKTHMTFMPSMVFSEIDDPHDISN